MYAYNIHRLVGLLIIVSLGIIIAASGQQVNVQQDAKPGFPYYHQTHIPVVKLNDTTIPIEEGQQSVARRGLSSSQNLLSINGQNDRVKGSMRSGGPLRPPAFVGMSTGRQMNLQPDSPISNTDVPAIVQNNPSTGSCMYDRDYLDGIDECLARKPYPTVGLPAFKNEDLMMQRGLSDKYGCQFILANGLFHNYQINKFNIESDGQCLDNSKVRLNLNFNNVSLNYMWTLRCLNRADQLLDDATQGGLTNLDGDENDDRKDDPKQTNSSDDEDDTICVGSSQNFGFSSLQLSSLESIVDLNTDIYKNWRITNADVAMKSHHPGSTSRQVNSLLSPDNAFNSVGTSIRDFTFESLDGDELNWRYLHLYKNWSRNQMHNNFLDQFRRFLWISIQNCLTEASDRLPKKPIEVFGNSKLL